MEEIEGEVLLPEGHRYAMFGGGEDYPIKAYYEGVFETVFVAFHPFYKPNDASPEAVCLGRLHSGDKNEVERCFEPVTWETVRRRAAFEDFKQLDLALRTWNGAIAPRDEFVAWKRRLEGVCTREHLYAPSDSIPSDLTANRVFRALLEMGAKWMWDGDDFCTERRLVYIQDTLEASDWDRHHRIFFGYQHDWLIVTPWESMCTLFCGSHAWVEQMVERCELEGFYCDDKTTSNWSLFDAKLR